MQSRILNAILSTAACCALASIASAQPQTHKLLPDFETGSASFTSSVAISGNTAIVGNRFDRHNDVQSGAAYLFDASTGTQTAKLTAEDGMRNDSFGVSVAVSGNTVIVGSHLDDDNRSNSGSAYLFDASTGAQIAKLTPDDGALGDHFGHSVAISGNTAIVGSFRDDDNGFNSGSAYLFDTSTGAQIAKLIPDDGAAEDWFGFSVAISGNTAIVGSYGDDDNGVYSGSAYLFDAQTGAQIAKLTPGDGEAYDSFGYSVAISGNTAIVGSYWDYDNENRSGSAYLLDARTGAQIAKLIPGDGAAYDNFGSSVAISGNTAIVGSRSDDDNGTDSGSAYLFAVYSGARIAKLTPGDGAPYNSFGYSVSIKGNTAIVVSTGGEESGAAYLFSVPNVAPEAANIIKDGEFRNDPNRSGPWSVVKTGDVDFVIASRLPEDTSEDQISDTSYLKIKSQNSDDEWTLGQLVRKVDEFGEYQLSFSARSKKGSDLIVALKGEGYGDVVDPYFLPPTAFDLTSKWQDFTVNFNIDERFKRLDHVLIAIGPNDDLEDNESIDIDHIFLSDWLIAEVPMPQKPTELNARFVSRSAVLLEWELPAGTAGTTGYLIFRDGTIVGSSNNRSYIDDNLVKPGPYLYEIVAIDNKGNQSDPSPARKVFNGPNVQFSEKVPFFGNMSPDGKAFLGTVRSEVTNNWQIKRWTEAGETIVFEYEKPNWFIIQSVANGGHAATGVTYDPESNLHLPFYWSEYDGFKVIGLDLPEGMLGGYNEGTAISADGNAVVGFLEVPSTFNFEAFRWTEADGIRWLGTLPGYSQSIANAVSDGGRVVVGVNEGQVDAGFIWTERGEIEKVEPLLGDNGGSVWDVSHYGSALIGTSWYDSLGTFHYRWSEADGFTRLQDLDGGQNRATLHAISGDGSMVVGTGTNTDNTGNAVFWNSRYDWSPININEFILSKGHDSEGDIYTTAADVSYDGQTFLLRANNGTNTRLRLNLSTRDSNTNLVYNGGFEKSWSSWELSRWEQRLSKEKKLLVAPGFMEEQAARIRMGNQSADPKTLHLSQSGIKLEPNSEYYLSFSVKASLPGRAKVSLLKDSDHREVYDVDKEFELSTEWQTQVIEFHTDALGEPVSDGRLQFTFVRGGYKRVLEFFVDEIAIHEK
ncbi:Carbohydrate binding domain protein [Verrucomicrobiia bacterium DG1235]|nr:Carbohydrate binding domain protein [Verrucomicrobiae bacterium DG1235]